MNFVHAFYFMPNTDITLLEDFERERQREWAAGRAQIKWQ